MKIIILAVIVLLSLLVVSFAFFSAKAQARDQRRLTDIAQIQQALQIYHDENGFYPSGSGSIAPQALADYLDHWPTNPSSAACPNPYTYTQLYQGLDYELNFCLERGKNGWQKGNYRLNAPRP